MATTNSPNQTHDEEIEDGVHEHEHAYKGPVNNEEENDVATVSTQEPSVLIRSNTKKIKGGWKWAILLLVNQGLVTLAFFGVGVNLVLFLTRVLRQDNANAANNVSLWTGTVYLFSLVGAFMSDSYWGRYLTCTICQLIFLVGLVLLSLISWIMLLKPKGCGDEEKDCHKPSILGQAIFYISIYLVAFGYGGHQPTVATFGADQFDDNTNPMGESLSAKASKAAFFSYFYFALNCGSLFSNTILVYYEDKGYWTYGFLASTGAILLGLVLFLSGSPRYQYVTAHGNPLPRVAQVFVAAYRKGKVKAASSSDLYEVQGASAIRGSRKITHTTSFKFLDKAATITNKDLSEPENPWNLCTISQVEEAKCVLRMLPIWLCTIIYSVIFTQMASLFVEQGDVMDNRIGNFSIPAASMSVFDIFGVFIFTGICRHVIVPLGNKFNGNPKGISELKKMGVGLIIGMLAMAAAGITEIERLKRVVPNQKRSKLSIFWQAPQYVLVGASEVFMYVGQLEFFNGQAPDGIKSLGSALCMASMSFGNYISTLLVYLVTAITSRGGDQVGWIPANLNYGHIDRFYFLILILSVVDFVIFMLCARWYKPITFMTSSGLKEHELKLEVEGPNEDEVIRRV